jgi:beta-galactosidase
LDLNRKIFREAGFDCTLFTCDGPAQMPKGYLPGFLPAVNGLDNPKEVKALIKKYHGGKGPYYIAEWYPGWFDSWGSPHQGSNADKDAKKLDEVLAAGISINLYMFHGGTTRGFMNGANMSKREPYSPQTSSYDYDAPLDEAGNPTDKYYKFRSVLEKYMTRGMVMPFVPTNNKTIVIKDIQLTGASPLFANLPKPVVSNKPLCFEDLDQGYGFVLYRTTIKNPTKGLLTIKEMRDFATVYLNGKRVAILDRHLRQNSVQLDQIPANSTLDILVENNGRINYGPYLADNRQGITDKVLLGKIELTGWKMYKFPFDKAPQFKYKPNKLTDTVPALYHGTFKVDEAADTYLDMRGFGKGFVFLNGHNLGKYWYIGPQQTLYVPASWLNEGQNDIVVFDELNADHTSISTLDMPLLNQVNKEEKK